MFGGLWITGHAPYDKIATFKTNLTFSSLTDESVVIRLSFPKYRKSAAPLDYATDAVTGEYGFELSDQKAATFGGTDGVRMVGAAIEVVGKFSTIGYAALIDGQPVTLVAKWPKEGNEADKVAAVDAIAASVRRQVESDWANAPGE